MQRPSFLNQITIQMKIHPICGVLGPRQVGKTTLARQYSKLYQGPVHLFDLENPFDRTRLEEPFTALSQFKSTQVLTASPHNTVQT